LKRELVGLTLTLGEFKTEWEKVIRALEKDVFSVARRGGGVGLAMQKVWQNQWYNCFQIIYVLNFVL
jgi:hypothetical protein